MATLLNSANFNGRNGTHFKLNLYYDYTQSVANNQTTITYSLYMQSLDGYSGSGATSTGYINNSSVGTFTSIGKNASLLIGTKSVTVTHNSDGTFPSTAYSALIDTPWTLGDASVSGNLTGLPTIPRASTPSLSNSNFNIGSSITLNTNRKSTAFTHTVVFKFGSYSRTYSNVGDSQTINTNDFASNMYAQIPNSKSGTGTITTTTYNGSTQIGSTSTLSFTANAVESNVNPQITGLTYTVDSTTSSLANSTSFINGVTTATIKATASSRYSSTLTKVFLWYYSGSNRVVLSSQNVSANGTYTFTISNVTVSKIYSGATDTRGYTTYNTSYNNVPTTFVNYVSLTADTSANIKRTNQTEAIVKINSFKGNYFNGSFGSQSNTLSIKWKYKEATASSYSAEYTVPSSNITISGNTYTVSNYTLTNGSTTELFNYQKAYNVQVIVRDKIYTRTVTYTITSGQANFAIFPNGNIIKDGKLALKDKYLFDIGQEQVYSDTYYLLGVIPATSSANGSTLRINGTLGAYGSNAKAIVDVIIGSRDGLNAYGTYTGTANAFEKTTIVIYTQSDNSYKIYIKFATGFHGGARLEVSGTNVTSIDVSTSSTTPTGTLSKTITYYSLTNLVALPQGLGNSITSSNGNLAIKKVTYSTDGTPNNGVILEYGTSSSWVGQLWLGDNATAGIAWNGWSNGTRGTWKHFAWEENGIVDKGTNYVKYGDGTMICYGSVSKSNVTFSSYEGAYYNTFPQITFPQTFSSTPIVQLTPKVETGLYTCSVSVTTTSTCSGYIWRIGAKTGVNYTIDYVAIGRWK